jgi:hypothetical protein
MRAHADEGITLLGCLQRIRHVDATDGQPWPDKGRKQRLASRWHASTAPMPG